MDDHRAGPPHPQGRGPHRAAEAGAGTVEAARPERAAGAWRGRRAALRGAAGAAARSGAGTVGAGLRHFPGPQPRRDVASQARDARPDGGRAWRRPGEARAVRRRFSRGHPKASGDLKGRTAESICKSGPGPSGNVRLRCDVGPHDMRQ